VVTWIAQEYAILLMTAVSFLSFISLTFIFSDRGH